MTAEERLAYFQGEKRRAAVYHNEKSEKNWALIWLKIKFFAAVLLFVVFLSLDYTGYQIQGVGSQEIIRQVTTDSNLSKIVEKFSL